MAVQLRAEALEDRTVPATFTVTDLSDAGPGTLRAAVGLANAAPDADTIVFAGPAVGGIVLLSTAGGTQFGPNALEVTTPITITGSGETLSRETIQSLRLIYVSPTGNLVLSNLTLSNGLARGGNGGTNLGDDGGGGGGGLGAGGAIYNQGTLTITGSTLSGNTARGGDGGAGANNAGSDAGGGGGGGGMGGNGGTTPDNGTDGGAGGGGFAGNGVGGAAPVGGGGGGTTSTANGAAGGVANGGTGGAAAVNGGAGGIGGGGGGGGDEGTGGAGGIGGGGGGSGEDDGVDDANRGGAGGFGGGGGGGGEDNGGGAGGFGGGGGGAANGGSAAQTGGTAGTFGGTGGSTLATRGSGGGGGGAGLGGAIFNDGGTITITGSTISTNTATGGTGGVAGGTAAAGGAGSGTGGGVFNRLGTVTVQNSTITGNIASGDGGGIGNTATLSLTNTTVSANTATTGVGGGIEQSGGTAVVTILGSNLTGNTSTQSGGALDVFGGSATITDTNVTGNKSTTINGGGLEFRSAGTVTINRVTVSGNQAAAGFGGGFRILSGTVNILNTTVVDNTSAGGGGFSIAGGTVSIVNSTITSNTDTGAAASRSGGVSATVGTVTLANSVIANNTTADAVARDVRGTFVAAGSKTNFLTFVDANTNLANGVNGNVVGADPLLGPLQSNGGPTQTRLPLAGSPLINAGSTTSVPAGTPFDQRGSGFLRVIGSAVDIGAVEVQPPFPLLVSGPANGAAAVFVPNPAGAYPASPAATVAPFGANGANVRAAAGDVNGDGFADSILVTGPGVPIRVAVVSGADDTTVLVAPFDPFGGGFTGGGYVAVGDLDGDGTDEFVVTPDQGGGPRVSVFSRNPDGTTAVRANFLGIDDASFRGGARAALGDVDNNGALDVVVAAGFGGGPRTAIFTGASVLAGSPARLVNDFFAFPGTDAVNLRNGSFVAAGDVTGDGFADLIFGGGPGGAPRVFILSGALVSAGQVDAAQATPVANFFVGGNVNDRGGVRVAATDADGDSKADVAVGSGEGSPANVRVYLGKDFVGSGEPATFQDLGVFGGGALPGGVFVG
ncbi:choice-of-anchor Q domain-containing protein [Urbifossiella limnaea]|uniref:FG-GAP repeat protein n=1 Tax=Urbifossiella limnaea TaxID=2528023 RepID=A0A517XQ64_9BACT|nr:choice-of-anchor Q domain-containing protein [Urbifossiella limnaea]QDU19643.1 FG-GAP repeat protein [Urbifossiella limnaea]